MAELKKWSMAKLPTLRRVRSVRLAELKKWSMAKPMLSKASEIQRGTTSFEERKRGPLCRSIHGLHCQRTPPMLANPENRSIHFCSCAGLKGTNPFNGSQITAARRSFTCPGEGIEEIEGMLASGAVIALIPSIP